MADSFESQSRQRSHFRISSVTRWGSAAVYVLLVLHLGIFAVEFYLQNFRGASVDLVRHTALSVEGLSGSWWSPLTFFLIHTPRDPVHFISVMVALAVVGPELERKMGARLFLGLFISSAIGAGAAHLLLSAAFDGLSTLQTLGAAGAVYGLLWAYFCFFPESEVLGLKGRWLVLLLFLLIFVSGWESRDATVEYRTQVSGAIAGAGFLLLIPRLRGLQGRLETRRQIRDIVRDAEVVARVDELLGKISREGMGSLTRAERKFLRRASLTYRRMLRGGDDEEAEGPS